MWLREFFWGRSMCVKGDGRNMEKIVFGVM
jgi:hypothetical protein